MGGGEIVCDKKNSAYIFIVVIIGSVGVQERVAKLRHQILLHIAPY